MHSLINRIKSMQGSANTFQKKGCVFPTMIRLRDCYEIIFCHLEKN